MPSSPERSKSQQETLIFPQAEQAQEFAGKVAEKLNEQAPNDVKQQREVVGQAVAEEFIQHGEAVDTLRDPWDHTPAEHSEAQQLVDEAFNKDLSAAIKTAQQSQHYPRNLDLFHDVLTNEMYDLIRQNNLNRQPLVGRLLFIAGIILAAVLVIALLLTAAA